MIAELGVRLIHEYVEIMQFAHSKLGVRLIHECVSYTRRYGIYISGSHRSFLPAGGRALPTPLLSILLLLLEIQMPVHSAGTML